MLGLLLVLGVWLLFGAKAAGALLIVLVLLYAWTSWP